MIIGHVGVALAARTQWPRTPLSWLLGATFAPDLWRLILSMTGLSWQDGNTYSHLLPWSGALVALVALAAYLTLRTRASALIVGGIACSHIALDMVSGWKPLWAGGPVGLDLEHVEQLEFVIEAGLAWAGWLLTRWSTAPRWVGRVRVLLLLLVIQGSYLAVSFRARPWKTRCITYPFSPCWTHL